jgi:type IV fimbrial biogenesis protein FimT
MLKKQAGFSMTELMVSLAIAAILGAVAVPSFSGLADSKRTQNYAMELYGAIAKTRSTAFKLNRNVSLVAKDGDWAKGWQVLDPADATIVLEDHGPAPGVAIDTGQTQLTFNASGRLPIGSTAPQMVVSTDDDVASHFQCVSVDLSGRPYMKSGETC